jgi:glucan 1,3-beta-glucosidase
VGNAGDPGQVQWSDMIVSTQGTQAGAILIEWNLNTAGTPSGMWDVHTRIGGFVGSDLQYAQCPSGSLNSACIGAYMSVHITPSAAGLYMENNWLWTADHDIDDPSNRQLTIYNGRGLLLESTAGKIWLYIHPLPLFPLSLPISKILTFMILQRRNNSRAPYFVPIPAR